jgi:NAD(P)-dependent dehydrogenase (short-subunit alcohol dehydrogenase family)
MAKQRPGDGQTALITGASGGIGVDLADCFARDGYDLILTARSEGALKEVAARLAREHGVTATPIANDLGAIGGGATLAGLVEARGLTVDVLVNNAGYGHAGALASSDRDTQLGMIDLNVRALVELTHIYWDDMLRRRRWRSTTRRRPSCCLSPKRCGRSPAARVSRFHACARAPRPAAFARAPARARRGSRLCLPSRPRGPSRSRAIEAGGETNPS